MRIPSTSIGPLAKPKYRIFQSHASPRSLSVSAICQNRPSIRLCAPTISAPSAPTAPTGRNTSPAIRIMHRPMTQITPASA